MENLIQKFKKDPAYITYKLHGLPLKQKYVKISGESETELKRLAKQHRVSEADLIGMSVIHLINSLKK